MEVPPLNVYGPPHPQKDNLTFGLELEFAIAILAPSSSDPHPSDPRSATNLTTGPSDSWIANLRSHVAATLFHAGLSAYASSPYADSPPPNSEISWIVKHDDTIQVPEIDGYHFLPIEINSPPFYYGTNQAFAEIKIACQVLRETYRISCNRSCGVHVHVGNGLNGFAFEAVQNLLATVWTFEPQFETIHSLYRVENSRMCPSFRRHSELARNHTVDGKLDVRGGLEEILGPGTEDFEVLVDLTEPRARDSYHGGSRLAYHLGDVGAERDLGASYRRTIEFRQHKGTLDFEELELWIKFCVQLVMFADSIERRKLAGFLKECVGKKREELRLEYVLKRLGMVWLAYCYPKKIAEGREVVEVEEEVLFPIKIGTNFLTTPP
ncbi:putative amidoligase enzyme-domain-containing protein [Rhexocercosporidium sp. MPI-PUGE-AT-0058]|nr:putative amidoligase enzyme-domain-containing protein [Rhexocercosporidium sp. MPI-PUGE-AT-0058]